MLATKTNLITYVNVTSNWKVPSQVLLRLRQLMGRFSSMNQSLSMYDFGTFFSYFKLNDVLCVGFFLTFLPSVPPLLFFLLVVSSMSVIRLHVRYHIGIF